VDETQLTGKGHNLVDPGEPPQFQLASHSSHFFKKIDEICYKQLLREARKHVSNQLKLYIICSWTIRMVSRA